METTVGGEITITPPLTHEELNDTPYARTPGCVELGYDPDVIIEVDEESVETREGILWRRTGARIGPRTEDAYKAYRIVEDVQAIVDRYGADREFAGELFCRDETGDAWSVVVRDGRAQRVDVVELWAEDITELRDAVTAFEHARGAVWAGSSRTAADVLDHEGRALAAAVAKHLGGMGVDTAVDTEDDAEDS